MGFSAAEESGSVGITAPGTTAREILEDYAWRYARWPPKFKARQPERGGNRLPDRGASDLPMEFESIIKQAAAPGTALAMAVDHEIGMVSLVRNLKSSARESCGWRAMPRRVAVERENSARWRAWRRPAGDIETLSNCVVSSDRVKPFCAHAPGAAEPLQSAIKYFREDRSYIAGAVQQIPI
ncbi:hypothetical protein KCP78_11025 [Salmonella enterica subsp. enterica]|nr:hypothetical protein KCP78_11025 [Salmonella enterica subsp. enterica]